MGHLNDLVGGMSDDCFFATCLYAVHDPVAGICTVARAGHPPPAVVAPDGSVRFAGAAADPPLGVAEPPFEVAELAIPDGGLLVFYTDGLIESADVDAGTGMNRLAGLLRTHHRETQSSFATASPPACCRSVPSAPTMPHCSPCGSTPRPRMR